MPNFWSVLVPDGYPESVSEGYGRFQVFDSLQALSSYFRGVVAGQVVLEGMGVGDVNATGLSATFQWVLRDGTGQIGGLLFAWCAASSFGRNIKRWRLFADVTNDIALTLEQSAPWVVGAICANFFVNLAESEEASLRTNLFTAVVCVSSLLKALCGVSAGATRAAITAHYAIRNNVADVQSKEGSQETLVSLVGMLGGLALASAFQDNPQLAVPVFHFLTVVHLWANHAALQALRLRSINASRLACLLEVWDSTIDSDATARAELAAVNRINAVEPLVFGSRVDFEIGVALPALDGTGRAGRVNALLLRELCRAPCAVLPRGPGGKLRLALRNDVGARDILAHLLIAGASAAVSVKNAYGFVDELERLGWQVDGPLALVDRGVRYEPA